MHCVLYKGWQRKRGYNEYLMKSNYYEENIFLQCADRWCYFFFNAVVQFASESRKRLIIIAILRPLCLHAPRGMITWWKGSRKT